MPPRRPTSSKAAVPSIRGAKKRTSAIKSVDDYDTFIAGLKTIGVAEYELQPSLPAEFHGKLLPAAQPTAALRDTLLPKLLSGEIQIRQ